VDIAEKLTRDLIIDQFPANSLKFREFLLIQVGTGRIAGVDDSNRLGFWSDKGLQNIHVYGPSFSVVISEWIGEQGISGSDSTLSNQKWFLL
jgi:hypothetical protein